MCEFHPYFNLSQAAKWASSMDSTALVYELANKNLGIEELASTWLPYSLPFACLAFLCILLSILCIAQHKLRHDDIDCFREKEYGAQQFVPCLASSAAASVLVLLACLFTLLLAIQFERSYSYSCCRAAQFYGNLSKGESSWSSNFIGLSRVQAATSYATNVMKINGKGIQATLLSYAVPTVALTDYINPANPICKPVVVYLPNSSSTTTLAYPQQNCAAITAEIKSLNAAQSALVTMNNIFVGVLNPFAPNQLATALSFLTSTAFLQFASTTDAQVLAQQRHYLWLKTLGPKVVYPTTTVLLFAISAFQLLSLGAIIATFFCKARASYLYYVALVGVGTTTVVLLGATAAAGLFFALASQYCNALPSLINFASFYQYFLSKQFGSFVFKCLNQSTSNLYDISGVTLSVPVALDHALMSKLLPSYLAANISFRFSSVAYDIIQVADRYLAFPELVPTLPTQEILEEMNNLLSKGGKMHPAGCAPDIKMVFNPANCSGRKFIQNPADVALLTNLCLMVESYTTFCPTSIPTCIFSTYLSTYQLVMAQVQAILSSSACSTVLAYYSQYAQTLENYGLSVGYQLANLATAYQAYLTEYRSQYSGINLAFRMHSRSRLDVVVPAIAAVTNGVSCEYVRSKVTELAGDFCMLAGASLQLLVGLAVLDGLCLLSWGMLFLASSRLEMFEWKKGQYRLRSLDEDEEEYLYQRQTKQE